MPQVFVVQFYKVVTRAHAHSSVVSSSHPDYIYIPDVSAFFQKLPELSLTIFCALMDAVYLYTSLCSQIVVVIDVIDP